MEENITLDPKKLSVVPIDEVRPNTWNPKDKDTDDYKKIVESIKLKGQRQAIVVRDNKGYEIIDGEQRWRACKELGFQKVIIYNEGVFNDKEAQELTLWYQVQVPFNEVALAQMITKLVTDFNDTIIPYSLEEIEEMKALIKFDWSQFKQESFEPLDLPITFSFTCTSEQAKIIRQAIEKVRNKAGTDISEARALELICADFLAGV